MTHNNDGVPGSARFSLPLGVLPGLIAGGAISGAATIIGAQHVLLTAGPSPSRG